MSREKKRLLVELIGQLANVNVDELLGGSGSFEVERIVVRGSSRDVVEMSKFNVEKLLKSPDHKDNVRIYSQIGQETPHLEYPRQKPILPGDYRFEQTRETAKGRIDAVEKRNKNNTS